VWIQWKRFLLPSQRRERRLSVNGRRLAAIIRKEFIQIKRDKASLGIIIMMPLLMMFLFGYAVTTNVDHISVAVLDQDKSAASRELIDKFRESTYFDFNYYVYSQKEISNLIDSGRVKGGFVIPANYSRDLKRSGSPQVQFVVDGSDPTVARTAMNTATILAQRQSMDIRVRYLEQRGVSLDSVPGIDFRPQVWFNPELDSIKFNIPGLIGLVLQNITVLLTAFALVRERERGTMEQLIVTPIKPRELIIGKLIPYVVIAFVDVIIVLSIGVYWFNVPVKGSMLSLMLQSLVFLLVALGLGILISTVARTQLQAMQMTVLLILPSVLLSGFIFPREAMPLPIQLLGNLIPLTYFLEILRGVILKGVGLEYLWKNLVTLFVIGTATLAVASLRFKKNLD
jgi:ABC-2 type transport system permease protein